MAGLFVHGVLPAAQSDQRPHAGVFPTSVRVDLDGPRFDGERTGEGSGDLAEGGGITTMTTGRMADEETKDAKPKSSSPWSWTLLGPSR
jgi:hypothetical protein